MPQFEQYIRSFMIKEEKLATGAPMGQGLLDIQTKKRDPPTGRI